ncbi:MAG: hypothetical protein ACRC0I_03485 [Sediminibacterium sp.]|jgi:hypothetical protein|nr:hypothetical protein [Chitinophagaceae bacterium]MCA6446294.1 hypothetical protein [Chitinophagaceae bacterium]
MASFRSFVGSELMSIKQHLAGLRNMIPGAVKLKPLERRSMFKLNAKRETFVQKAIQQMRRNPKTVPAYIDVTICNNYVQLFEQYNELLKEMDEVKTKLEDAKLLLGNEILRQTSAYYKNAKTAADAGGEEYQLIYKELKPYYAVGRNTKASH